MSAAMVAVLAAVALGSGLGPVSQPAQAIHFDPVTAHCTYESGNGDLVAIMKDDQTGLANDDMIDQGGCIWNRPNTGDCVTAVAREAGSLGEDLGALTLGEIASRISLNEVDCPAQIETELREFEATFADDLVDISVEIVDDAFGSPGVSGILCTEGIDTDPIACQHTQVTSFKEWRGRICNGHLRDGPLRVDMSKVNHVVVFIDGPATSSEAHVDDIECPGSTNVIGGTTGGVFIPGRGVTVTFSPVL